MAATRAPAGETTAMQVDADGRTPGMCAIANATADWKDGELAADDERFMESQAGEEGITAEHVEALFGQLRSGSVRLADALGMTEGQLAAMAYRASELLRANEPKRALKIYLGLYELDPYNYRYQRGAALCFHFLRQYGFALGYYRLAEATKGERDFVCMALLAECLLPLQGKAAAIAALEQAFSFGAKDAGDETYLERARAFRARLALGA